MNENSFSFVIYMIHACADRWKVSPSRVYQALKKSGCLDQYLDYKVLVQILLETEPELLTDIPEISN